MPQRQKVPRTKMETSERKKDTKKKRRKKSCVRENPGLERKRKSVAAAVQRRGECKMAL